MFTKKQILGLMIPILVEQFFGILVGIADTMMVSSVGEAAVSGVSLVDSVNAVMFFLVTALAAGGSIVCSQQIGAGRLETAKKSAGQLCLICTAVGILAMVVFLLGNKLILKLIFGKVENDVMTNARIYFAITAFSIPVLALQSAGGAIFRAEGNSKISMNVSLIVNIINICGNALCVFVFKMGVAGVAVPTLISRIIGALIMCRALQNPKNQLCIPNLFKVGYDKKITTEIMKIGLPSGLENCMFQFGKLVLQSLVSTLGTASIAGYSVACSVAQVHYLIGGAIGIGLITVVGQCVGAQKYDEAKKYTMSLIGINYLCLLVICSLSVIFVDNIVSAYSLAGKSKEIAAALVVIHSFAMTVWPVAFPLAHTLRAASDVSFTMIISTLSMWVFRVGCSYLFVLVFDMGIYGIWYAMFTDWVFRAVVFLYRFFSGKWLKHTINQHN